jgi:hypothetical protein
MTTIGFANQFYTLWDVLQEEHYTTDAYGKHWHSGTSYKYLYCKNVSISLDKVKALYPGVPINEELRGITRSFEKSTNNASPFPSDFFGIGKYTGRKFSDVDDESYYSWFLTNKAVGEQKELIESILVDRYNWVKFEDEVYQTQEQADEIKYNQQRYDARQKLYVELIDKTIDVEVEFAKNLSVADYFAYYNDLVYGHLRFNNGMFKEMYYDGHRYGLPTVNGVGKRIKNKKALLTITTDNHNEDYEKQYFKVTNFKII